MSVTVTLGMTTWNTWTQTPWNMTALLMELGRLNAAGFHASLVCADNASLDGTGEYLDAFHKRGRLTALHVESPVGVSVLRNAIVRHSAGSDYILFVDGDIEVIPHSVVAMVRGLEEYPHEHALAMDPLNTTSVKEEATHYCPIVRDVRREALMYLCGYGLFRRSVFETIRFEESGPFASPGWGSEDDDLHLQMLEAGMRANYVLGYTYYHGERHSSWPSLKALGIDPLKSHEERRGALMTKWRKPGFLRIADRLPLLEGQHLHA